MKYLSILILSVALLSGCGSSTSTSTPACSTSTLLGTYTGSILGNSDTMTISDSCAVTSSYCQSTATVPNVTAASGALTVTVSATPGKSGCLPLGTTSCAYSVSATSLTFTCGASVLTYTKQ